MRENEDCYHTCPDLIDANNLTLVIERKLGD